MARLGAHGGVAEIAWSPDGRRLAFTAEVDPPRFITGRTRPVSRRGTAKGAGRSGAARPAHHPLGLAMDERVTATTGRTCSSSISPGGSAAPGDRRGLGRRRYRPASRRPHRDFETAGRGRPTPADHLGPRRRHTDGGPREVLAPGGWAQSGLVPDGTGRAGLLRSRAPRRRQPWGSCSAGRCAQASPPVAADLAVGN